MSEKEETEFSDAVLAAGEDTGTTKEKVAEQSLRGEVTQEDASRSNLHYGDQADPDADRPQTEAAYDTDGTDASAAETGQHEIRQRTPSPGSNTSDMERGTPAAAEPERTADREGRQSSDAQFARSEPEAPPFETPRDNADAGTFTSVQGDQSTSPDSGHPTLDRPSSQPAAGSEEATSDVDASAPPPNQAPTQLSLDPVHLDENDAGAVIGQLSVVDPNADDQHVFTISDDRFETSGGQIKLKPGVFLDHEEQSSLSFSETATDADGASLTETFEIFIGDINEAPTGISIDESLIAADHLGAVVGQMTVTDPDQEANYEFTVSDDRFEVSQGQLKLRDDISLTSDDLGDLAIEVTVTDQGGETLSQTFDFGVVETASTTVTSGFHASYFDVDHRLSKLDQIDWSGEATHEEVVNDINYANSRDSFWEGGSKDTFGARITGNIEVEEGGTFEFFVGGDDGVILLINGEEVIDNDGLHGFRTRTGEVELEPGTHHIEVRYFENYGHAGLKLEWEGPGTDGRELVTAPEADTLQTVNGVPIAIEVDVSIPDTATPDQVSHHVEGLPPGTVLSSGDLTVEAGPDGTADISDFDLSLLSVTTPIDFTGQVSATVVTTTQIGDENTVSVTSDLDFEVNQAVFAPPSAQMETGFRASYFDVDHRLSKLDQIDWSSEATHEEVVGEINYTNSRESFWEDGSKDTFGVRITGDIDVEEGGTFDFFLGGDDGAVLFINGQEVIDNDGLHGYRTRTGEIELEPGTHSIEVRYFENYGHAGLKLEWEGPGTDGRALVNATDDLAVPQNGMMTLGIDDDTLSDAAIVKISGLPADTILMSDDNVAVSDGGEIDLSGWDLSLLEMAPPPNFEGVISGEITTTDTVFNGQTVVGQDSFSIEVGDVDHQQASQRGDDRSDDLATYENGGGASSWVETAEEDDQADGQGEDPMSEEVIDNQGAEQGHEMNETYERQDW